MIADDDRANGDDEGDAEQDEAISSGPSG